MQRPGGYASLGALQNNLSEIRDTARAFVPNYLPIPGPSDDARAIRTRAAIADALINLMLECSYDEINVQQICVRAQVGRSTFYAHFQDKDDIFIRHTVTFARSLGRELSWDVHQGYRFPVRRLFEHVGEMRALFESLTRSGRASFVMTVLLNNLAEQFQERIDALRTGMGVTATVSTQILAQHLAGTLMTLLNWWLAHHQPYDARQMEAQWTHLVAGLR